MPKRPLPDSRNAKQQRTQRLTQRVAVAFVVVISLLGLALYLLA